MIENLTVSVTGACNSRCTMCDQWKNDNSADLTPKEFEDLFERPEFAGVEYLNITGGEPFIRKDIREVVEAIIRKMQMAKVFFISTNGTNPKGVEKFVKDFSTKHEDVGINVTVSIDGDREVNRRIRGIDSYRSGIETIELCHRISERIKTMISTTLTPANCSFENLMDIKKIAEDTGSTFSFRMGAKNEYYRNQASDLEIPEEKIKEVIEFSRRFCTDNVFLTAQAEFLETGRLQLMGTTDNLKCRAGNTFTFVDSKGDIFPCINSTRKIGNKKDGIITPIIEDLGSKEQCICCTECTFYPMHYAKD